MNEFLIILAGVGITNIIVYSSIFEPIRSYFSEYNDKLFRKIGELLNCPLCCGTWIGIFFSFIFPIHLIISMGTISLCSHFYAVLVDYLQTSSESMSDKSIEGDINE